MSLKSKHGYLTGEFGYWLTQYLQNSSHHQKLAVFYDHGEKEDNPNVVAIKGFYGHQVSNKNRLADIDVMVVNNDKEVKLLIEIEESKMSPKKLLGDVFAILMCNQVSVTIENKRKDFCLSSNSHLIVAGIVSSRGRGQDKIINTIMPRLQKFKVPDDSIRIDKIKCVLGEDISKVIEILKNEINTVLG